MGGGAFGAAGGVGAFGQVASAGGMGGAGGGFTYGMASKGANLFGAPAANTFSAGGT